MKDEPRQPVAHVKITYTRNKATEEFDAFNVGPREGWLMIDLGDGRDRWIPSHEIQEVLVTDLRPAPAP